MVREDGFKFVWDSSSHLRFILVGVEIFILCSPQQFPLLIIVCMCKNDSTKDATQINHMSGTLGAHQGTLLRSLRMCVEYK